VAGDDLTLRPWTAAWTLARKTATMARTTMALSSTANS